MKKAFLFLAVALTAVACQKDAVCDDSCKIVRFDVNGDFTSPVFSYGDTRAGLSADGSEMTDLWLLDYMGGELVQTVHQTPADADWGSPSVSLAFGSHVVYFVASRGDSPVLSTESETIEWSRVSDTFWKAETVNIDATTSANRSVTLGRVATRLRLVVNDKVADDAASVVITPQHWYYGINYVTGEPVADRQEDRVINIPQSYKGTEGQLAVSIFGISGADEWTTDVTVSSRDADNDIMGRAVISSVPFKRNRVTEYSGNLFSAGGGMSISLDDTWEQSYTGTW